MSTVLAGVSHHTFLRFCRFFCYPAHIIMSDCRDALRIAVTTGAGICLCSVFRTGWLFCYSLFVGMGMLLFRQLWNRFRIAVSTILTGVSTHTFFVCGCLFGYCACIAVSFCCNNRTGSDYYFTIRAIGISGISFCGTSFCYFATHFCMLMVAAVQIAIGSSTYGADCLMYTGCLATLMLCKRDYRS